MMEVFKIFGGFTTFSNFLLLNSAFFTENKIDIGESLVFYGTKRVISRNNEEYLWTLMLKNLRR
jgi:hypothetical protein